MNSEEITFLVKELYKIDFFSKLSSDEVDTLLEKFYKHTFKKGSTIVRQGKGLLKKKLLAELDPGSYFGEISLLSDEPTTAAISAAEKTEIFLLNRTDFKQLLASNHQLADKIRTISENRLIEASF